jgi:hypothetical protein
VNQDVCIEQDTHRSICKTSQNRKA